MIGLDRGHRNTRGRQFTFQRGRTIIIAAPRHLAVIRRPVREADSEAARRQPPADLRADRATPARAGHDCDTSVRVGKFHRWCSDPARLRPRPEPLLTAWRHYSVDARSIRSDGLAF